MVILNLMSARLFIRFASEKHCVIQCEHLFEPWEEVAGAVLIGVFLNVSTHNSASRLRY